MQNTIENVNVSEKNVPLSGTNSENRKGIVISVMNNKGGSGKTTTAKNLAYELALQNNKVLIIDLDMQCNATIGLSRNNFRKTIIDFIKGRKNCIFHTRFSTLDLIPGDAMLGISIIKKDLIVTEILSEKIKQIKYQYDYVIIDNSPYFNEITAEVILSSNMVLIPAELQEDAIEGMATTINELNTLNPRAKCRILFTKVDNYKSTRNDLAMLKEELGDLVLNTYIRYNSNAVKKARERRIPISYKYEKQAISVDYKNLALEIIQEVK